MNRINSFTTGLRVQQPTTPTTGGASRTGFGSLVQGGGAQQSAAFRPGDPLMTSGGQVVSSALASVGSAPHTGLMNSYLSAVGRGPISAEGSREPAAGTATQAQPGSEQAKQEQALMDLAALSAATLGNSIIHMGNKMKISLDT
ncbi:hypothetical protein HPC49_23320 [Pyxidicoccus fallax]|uniref:Uncharacterized protein n=1 Tax=Pyxidicoccus fallax TaxID=394095 RepID=A0A848L9C2_9BACT|nr:hypothetical protein [Pyxidicoccus fallax]NMO13445.1 hypothetical protein [Pyxidicoccus fallax]NPC81145.1 hypothetical protein [Pyxidicoccus fallax]